MYRSDPTSYARTDGRQCFTEVPLSFNDYTLKTVNSQLFAQYDLLSPPKSFDITVYGEYVKDGVSSFCPYDAATCAMFLWLKASTADSPSAAVNSSMIPSGPEIRKA